MAVAEKKAQETSTSSVFDRVPVVSLVGVVYVLGCLSIIFKLVPDVWRSVWGGIGLQVGSFPSMTLMAMTMMAATVGLIFLGLRLLGPKQQPGVRAGIFFGLLYFLGVLLLTRWVSMWIEHWIYYGHWFGEAGRTVGIILTILAGAGLLFLSVRWFLRPGFERMLVRFEGQGWFSATSYKPQQGQKVRRGTILGILLLFGAGIYTMISHNILARGSEHWEIGIPFTGTIKNIAANDALAALNRGGFTLDTQTSDCRIVTVFSGLPAATAGLREGDVVTKVKIFERVVTDPNEVNELVAEVLKPGDKVVLTVRRDGKEIETAVSSGRPASTASLQKGDVITRVTIAERLATEPSEVNKLVQEVLKPGDKAELTIRRDEKEKDVILFISHWDRDGVPAYEFRKILDYYSPSDFVRIQSTNDILVTYTDADGQEKKSRTFTPNEIVKRSVIDSIKKKLDPAEAKSLLPNAEEATKSTGEKEKPVVVAAAPPSGPMELATIRLLPHIKFTLPFVLLAASLWFAWRVVNLPVFADFLIATEAELNKVSWTTRKRLYQDTVVVLTTLVMMALLLFAMDQLWLHLLSWKRVGVIYSDDAPATTSKGGPPLP